MSKDNTSRRTALKLIGTAIGVSGTAGPAAAHTKGANDEASSTNEHDVNDLRLVGEVAIDGANELVVTGKYVYVATREGIAVVDAKNPRRPQKVVEMDVPGVAVNDIRVEGDLLGVCSQGSQERGDGDTEEAEPSDIGTHFYDVSEPTDPTHLGTWIELPAGLHNHFLDDEYAYLCREIPFDDSALRILDVSDPTDPVEVAEWRVEDEHPELDQPVNFIHHVTVQDDLAYLAYWDAGAYVLDVSDPSDPVEVSKFATAPDATEPVEGDYDKLAEEPESEFTQRALGLPGNIHTHTPGPNGDYAYLSEETFVGDPGGIRVFDITDLSDPTEVTRIDPPSDVTSEYAHFFDVTRTRLHSAWIDGGVRLFDIADPSDPDELARYDPDGFSSSSARCMDGFTVADFTDAGIVFLHREHGEKREPSIDEDDAEGC